MQTDHPRAKKKESEIKIDEEKDVESEDEATKASTVNDILSDASKKDRSSSPKRKVRNNNFIEISETPPLMYVDVQKLKNSLERIAYPLYGSQPLDSVLIDQLLYCSKIQDYFQKVVNEYSGQNGYFNEQFIFDSGR